jgi:hypothetical protein
MSRNPIVICLSGLAGSGKDTVADELERLLRSKFGLKVCKIALAGRVKIICKHLIKLFYNIDIPTEDFYDTEKKEQIRDDLPLFAGKPFKIRTIMQMVGTEIFRNLLWFDIWCDYVKSHYLTQKDYDVIIISDCRMKNEITYFKELKNQSCLSHVISYKIIRPSHKVLDIDNSKHQSEIEIESLPVDYEIINDGTINELYGQVLLIADKIVNLVLKK